MASQLQTLSPSQHRGHGWKRFDNYRFAGGDSVAPLAIAEVSAALPFYPLAFTRRPGGGYWLVALQGLHAGENLYLGGNGRWQAGYIPSIYRCYPFALVKVDDKDKMALCFERASGLYREAPNPALGEERFFSDEGQPQPRLQQVLEFLGKTAANRERTFGAVDALEAAGLLEPWQLPVENPNPQIPLLTGLYRLNETALNALDGQKLALLRSSGALAIAYAQLFSMARVGVLRRLYDLRAPQKEQAPLVSLDALFGEGNDELIRFD
jgi:hypothetical protein